MAQASGHIEEYAALYSAWQAHPSWWFSPTADDDATIASCYGQLATRLLLVSTAPNDIGDISKSAVLGMIIAADQVPRHMQRRGTASACNVSELLHKVALPLAERLLRNQGVVTSVFDLVFACMPLRHSRQYKRVCKAGRLAFEFCRLHRSSLCNRDLSLLRRFITATYTRAPVHDQSTWLRIHAPVHDADDAGDPGVTTSCWSDVVCESAPPARMTRNRYDTLDVNTLKTESPAVGRVVARICEYIAGLQKRNGNMVVIIMSVSGGVDSMVMASVVARLIKAWDFGSLCVQARCVHINYQNRAEAEREEEFVVAWCTRALGLECVVRRIDELTRQECRDLGLREMYESYTRSVRFGTYAAAAAAIERPDGSTSSYDVLLGHNRDDVFENIVCNIKYGGAKATNLAGMSREDVVSPHVTVMRPLLDIDKRDLVTCAHLMRIPYLKDTTVPWSTRFAVRDRVRPALDAFGATEGLFRLAATMADMSSIMRAYVAELAASVRSSGHLAVPVGHPVLTSDVFARAFFTAVFSSHAPERRFYVSNKSLASYLERAHNLKEGASQRVLLNQYHAFTLSRPVPVPVTASGHHLALGQFTCSQ